jgi:hypothetical protein
MNVEIRTETAQFLWKEYINGIFVAVYYPFIKIFYIWIGLQNWKRGNKIFLVKKEKVLEASLWKSWNSICTMCTCAKSFKWMCCPLLVRLQYMLVSLFLGSWMGQSTARQTCAKYVFNEKHCTWNRNMSRSVMELAPPPSLLNSSIREASTSHTERGKGMGGSHFFCVSWYRRWRSGFNSNDSKIAWSRFSAFFLYKKSFIVMIYVENSKSPDEYNTKN